MGADNDSTLLYRRTRSIELPSSVTPSSPNRSDPLPQHSTIQVLGTMRQRRSIDNKFNKRGYFTYRYWWQRTVVLLLLGRIFFHWFDLHARVLLPQVTSSTRIHRNSPTELFLRSYWRGKTITEPNWRLKTIWTRRRARQKRTTPPTQRDIAPPAPTTLALFHNRNNTILQEKMPDNWKKLCQKAGLNKKSRVIVYGIVTQSPAAAWALATHRHCNVADIFTADTIFPNLRIPRMKAMANVWKILVRHIPRILLMVPYFGLTRKGEEAPRGLDFARPTHILYFETNPQEKSIANFMSMDQYQRYHERNEQVTWTQLLEAAHKYSARVLRISSQTPQNDEQWTILNNYYSSINVSISKLTLPPLYGPLVETSNTTLANHLFVDHAVSAIFQSLAMKDAYNIHVPLSWTIPFQTLQDQLKRINDTAVEDSIRQTWTWKYTQNKTYTVPPNYTNSRFWQTYGIQPNASFPCATQCHSLTLCTPSAFDSIINISQQASENCTYAVYYQNFSSQLESIYVPREVDETLCRIAFISGKSPLLNRVREQLKTDDVQAWNGKVKMDNWTIVWLPNHDDKSLSDADLALPRIDPSRLFASTVEKAMLAELEDFATTPDDVLFRIIDHVDRMAHPGRWFRHEYRPGTNVHRAVAMPPERARKVALFGGEPSENLHPTTVRKFVELNGVTLPRTQVKFYEQAAHFVQMNELRPDSELASTVYKTFPFQWMAMSLLIHDFTMEESRQLRCEWFDEYLYWGSNRDAEALSLAFILGQKRILQQIGPEDDGAWSPLLTPSGDHVLTEDNSDVYIRVMRRHS